MSEQIIENTWKIYNILIEKTIEKASSDENIKVLEKLKVKWIENLEKLIGDAKNQIENTNEVKIESDIINKVKKKDEVSDEESLLLDTGKSAFVNYLRPSYTQICNIKKDEHLESRDNNCFPDLDYKIPTRQLITQKSIVDEPTDKISSTDQASSADGWEDWNDEKKNIQENETVQETSNLECKEVKKTEDLNTYLPNDEDFKTKLITHYGNQSLLDFDEDPDFVNSDLNEVETLDYNEPYTDDVIVGFGELVSRPTSKKNQAFGIWHVKIKGGLASIKNQEFFFSELDAKFNF